MIANIKGHSIKFGYGLYFLGKAQKEHNTDLQGLLQSLLKNPIADMVDLMYYSAKCEAELDEVNLKITKREFLTHLEETKDFDDTNGLLAKWSNSLVGTIKGNFLPEESEDKIDSDAEKKN